MSSNIHALDEDDKASERPSKRVRVEADGATSRPLNAPTIGEDSSEDEQEEETVGKPETTRASDLYLDTVRTCH